MNKILDYNVTGQHIELSSAAMLVAGTVNEYTARFAFSSDWDGYQRVAVFNADGTEREQLLTDDTCTVPWEVLLPGVYLKVGVYGTKDGSRLPTIWTTHRQYIHDGAGPTDEAADPSPVLAEQILQRMGNLGDLKTEDKSSLVAAVNEVKETGGGGTADHAKLQNRDAADQHPMSAITGLVVALAGKQPTGDYLTEELDPTVPEWAKQPQKPAYTAQEVGALPATTAIPSTAADVNAEPSGAVSQHNVSDAAHSDIRLLIQGLSERLSAVADSDDATLDQLSEIVAYIKSNKILIDAITTSKVNVADIVDNLTTNVANKPLSAAQGVALKALIDALTDAMPEAYNLPIASPTVLGGVKPVAKTDAMTQSVGVDAAGALFTAPGSGGGSSGGLEKIVEITMDEEVTSVSQDLTDEQRLLAGSCKVLYIHLYIKVSSVASNSAYGKVSMWIKGVDERGNTPWTYVPLSKLQCIPKSGVGWQTYSNVYQKHNLTQELYFNEKETAVCSFQNGGGNEYIAVADTSSYLFNSVVTTRIVAEAESAFGAGSKIELYGLR